MASFRKNKKRRNNGRKNRHRTNTKYFGLNEEEKSDVRFIQRYLNQSNVHTKIPKPKYRSYKDT